VEIKTMGRLVREIAEKPLYSFITVEEDLRAGGVSPYLCQLFD
jgi:hypothetical protein